VAPGIRLPTLARDEQFAYLCVHGASSAWFRLKWISDLAGVLHGQSGEMIERLFERSQALGAERAAGQALLLADRLFGSLDEIEQLLPNEIIQCVLQPEVLSNAFPNRHHFRIVGNRA